MKRHVFFFAVLAGAAVLLVGCGRKKGEDAGGNAITDKLMNVASGGRAKVDSSDGTVKITTREGTTVVTAAALPANFPKDVPIYRGASVVNSVQGEDAIGVTLQTTDSVKAVADFYRREMASRGWQEEANVTLQGNTMMTYVLADRTLNVVINDAGEARVIALGLTLSRDSAK